MLHDHLQPYRAVEYDEKVQATFHNYDSIGVNEDGRGKRFVAVELWNAASDAPKQTGTLLTDLGRLEAVAARAQEIMQSPNGLGDASIATERIEGQEVTFFASPTFGKPESLEILMEEKRESPGPRQLVRVSLEQLQAVLEDGHAVEKELKYDQAVCHTIVYAGAIKRNEETGKIEGPIGECFDDRAEARLCMHKRAGTALLPGTKRPPSGDIVEIPPGTILEMSHGSPRTVEQQIDVLKLDRERRSEDYAIAKWQYGAPPIVGVPVRLEGIGWASNGDFEDYKAVPYGSPPSKPKEDLYLLVRRDKLNPGQYVIEEISRTRDELPGKLAKAQERTLNPVDEVQRRITHDLSQEQFSPKLRKL